MSPSPPVTASGLTFSYGEGPQVLTEVDVTLEAGEILGLVGVNGSGKTTLLRLIAGLLRPQEGTLEITIPDPVVIFDRLPFQEALTGAENVRATLALRGRKRATDQQIGARLLTDFGLAQASDQAVSEYSFGMRRRLALAEAFASEPLLLLLDEPTVGLDPLGRDSLAQALAEVSTRDAAVLVATNDAEFAESSCSRVLLMHQGQVVAEGTPATLIARLEAATVIAVEFTGPGPVGSPPPGLVPLGASHDQAGLEFSSRTGTAILADLCAWFVDSGANISSVRVRDPGLADVLRSVSGAGIASGPEPDFGSTLEFGAAP